MDLNILENILDSTDDKINEIIKANVDSLIDWRVKRDFEEGYKNRVDEKYLNDINSIYYMPW